MIKGGLRGCPAVTGLSRVAVSNTCRKFSTGGRSATVRHLRLRQVPRQVSRSFQSPSEVRQLPVRRPVGDSLRALRHARRMTEPARRPSESPWRSRPPGRSRRADQHIAPLDVGVGLGRGRVLHAHGYGFRQARAAGVQRGEGGGEPLATAPHGAVSSPGLPPAARHWARPARPRRSWSWWRLSRALYGTARATAPR